MELPLLAQGLIPTQPNRHQHRKCPPATHDTALLCSVDNSAPNISIHFKYGRCLRGWVSYSTVPNPLHGSSEHLLTHVVLCSDCAARRPKMRRDETRACSSCLLLLFNTLLCSNLGRSGTARRALWFTSRVRMWTYICLVVEKSRYGADDVAERIGRVDSRWC